MLRSLSRLFSGTPSQPAAKPSRARIGLEALEDRLTPTVSIINGDVYIFQTNGNDYAAVSRHGTAGYFIEDNGASYDFSNAQVWGGDVYLYAYGGNDYFISDGYLRINAYGGDGNDTLYGGRANDYIFGQNGNDVLAGYFGNDYLDGGYGSDNLYGEYGNDTLVAGYDYSYNYLNGGDGDDYLYGGYGVDYMNGDYGNDYLYGNAGYDVLYGHFGNDYLNGGDDNVADYLSGGSGADTFVAEREYFVVGTLAANSTALGQWPAFWWNRDNPYDFNASEGDVIV